MKYKMPLMEHTPTPWYPWESPNDYEGKLIQTDEKVIAAIRIEDIIDATWEEEANAEFIIRACNLFDDLVSAAENACDRLEALMGQATKEDGEVIEQLKLVISKAYPQPRSER